MPRHGQKAEESSSSTTTLAAPDRERLYWLGALPAIGSFEVYRSSQEKTTVVNSETGEYVRIDKTTAYDSWFKREMREWHGKCRYFQNIAVKGWAFVAFTERRIDQLARENQVAMEPWPGQVAKFAPEDMKALLASVHNHILREGKGKGERIQNMGNVRILDLAAKPPTDYDRSNPLERPLGLEKVTFNPKLDSRIEEYVYIVPLDADPDMDPRDFHLQAPPMNEFLVKPPQSVAEMWTEKKEAVA